MKIRSVHQAYSIEEFGYTYRARWREIKAVVAIEQWAGLVKDRCVCGEDMRRKLISFATRIIGSLHTTRYLYISLRSSAGRFRKLAGIFISALANDQLWLYVIRVGSCNVKVHIQTHRLRKVIELSCAHNLDRKNHKLLIVAHDFDDVYNIMT